MRSPIPSPTGTETGSSTIQPIAIYDKSFRKPDFELSRGNVKETLAMGTPSGHDTRRDAT